jgi:hypothetical protein
MIRVPESWGELNSNPNSEPRDGPGWREHWRAVVDARDARGIRHRLDEISVIVTYAVICWAEHGEERGFGPGLRTRVAVERERTTGKHTRVERRYLIGSRAPRGKGHWSSGPPTLAN